MLLFQSANMEGHNQELIIIAGFNHNDLLLIIMFANLKNTFKSLTLFFKFDTFKLID